MDVLAYTERRDVVLITNGIVGNFSYYNEENYFL